MHAWFMADKSLRAAASAAVRDHSAQRGNTALSGTEPSSAFMSAVNRAKSPEVRAGSTSERFHACIGETPSAQAVVVATMMLVANTALHREEEIGFMGRSRR